MRSIIKLLLIVIGITSFFSSCKKVHDLPFYGNGTATVLTASSTTVVPTPADSSKPVLTLSWTNPQYATDSAHQRFILEVDSSGRNFTQKVSFEIDGPLSYTFTGSQLNNILANFGFKAGVPFKVDMRLISSYANNNERYTSNAVTITMTPFLVPITLTPSSTTPLVLQISNAEKTAIAFTWNASTYGNNTISYALQVDTVGDNFAHPQVFQYGTALNSSLLQKDLNIAAINAGVTGGSTKKIEFRIVSYLGSGYTNPLVYSNVVAFNVTTYVPVPDNLYIVGDATPGGWNNPVPIPSQQFRKIDNVSFEIIINLTAGNSYLLLPLNGDWVHKYGGASAAGGTLLSDGAVPGSNTPAPATSGLYKIVVNFQTNTYTVTPFVQGPVPANLYIVGDATPGAWNNPVPTPSQQFTKIDATTYGIIINLTAGKSYLFLPVNGDWNHKFGGSSATGGALLEDNAVPGSNTPAPVTDGLYKIIVNFQTNTYTVTPYTGMPLPDNLFIVGDATAGGWNNPVPVPSQQFTRTSNAEFQITLPLTGGKEYLLLPVNGDWTHKYSVVNKSIAGLSSGGAFGYDLPDNFPAPATSGTYKITVNFLTGKFTVQ
jgi:hypothetical protein